MIYNDYTGGFPRLTPDGSIRFTEKDEIKRSPEMNFECSETEYLRMIEEEEKDETVKLAPDKTIVMPDKNALKRATFRSRLPRTIAAAAIIALMLTVTDDKRVTAPDTVTKTNIAVETKPEPITAPDTVTKTNIAVETKPEPETAPDTVTKTNIAVETKPQSQSGAITLAAAKSSENKTVVQVKKSDSPTEQSETVKSETTERNIPDETTENNDSVTRPEIARIERISSGNVAAETMSRNKTVFVYINDHQQSVTSRITDDVRHVVEKISDDADGFRQNISHKLANLRLPDVLNRLNPDSGIDREIDKWAKNNPDIPFDVFVDNTAENKMKEIYDEDGNLVRVVFFAEKSIKYKNSKTQTLNN
jgi:hypothetical protein